MEDEKRKANEFAPDRKIPASMMKLMELELKQKLEMENLRDLNK